MSLRHILLGMLATPASGYDLKKDFEDSLNNFWNAELAQIYPTLNKLEEEGLISSKVTPSSQGPNRKVYCRLKAGQKELVKWLKQGPMVPKTRIDYAAQFSFLGELSYKERLEFVYSLQGDTQKRLAVLQKLAEIYPLPGPEKQSEHFSTKAEKEEYTLQALIIHHGLLRLQALLDWCDLVLKQLGATALKQ
jgi:PadR family transcriptional regulator, regulatory protein AphA